MNRLLKFLHRDLEKGGGKSRFAPPPLPKYEIMEFGTSEHTDGRVHFTGLIEDVPGYIWGETLTSDLAVRQQNQW